INQKKTTSLFHPTDHDGATHQVATTAPIPSHTSTHTQIMKRLPLATILSLAFISSAVAHDDGRFNNVDPEIKEWFKSVRDNRGNFCCDIADGRRTTWRSSKDGGYEVLVDDKWLPVPPESVIHRPDNPTGESIVWLAPHPVEPWVRCFVPGNG